MFCSQSQDRVDSHVSTGTYHFSGMRMTEDEYVFENMTEEDYEEATSISISLGQLAPRRLNISQVPQSWGGGCLLWKMPPAPRGGGDIRTAGPDT
jgi:hypothetical protein